MHVYVCIHIHIHIYIYINRMLLLLRHLKTQSRQSCTNDCLVWRQSCKKQIQHWLNTFRSTGCGMEAMCAIYVLFPNNLGWNSAMRKTLPSNLSNATRFCVSNVKRVAVSNILFQPSAENTTSPQALWASSAKVFREQNTEVCCQNTKSTYEKAMKGEHRPSRVDIYSKAPQRHESYYGPTPGVIYVLFIDWCIDVGSYRNMVCLAARAQRKPCLQYMYLSNMVVYTWIHIELWSA